MTTKGEWVTYTGSDEQIAELKSARNGWIWGNNRKDEGSESEQYGFPSFFVQENMTRYWIIPEDPLREMKVRWAMTGQPAYIRVPISDKGWSDKNLSYTFIKEKHGNWYYVTTTPDWNIPNAEYSFTPFEDTSK